VLLGHARVDQTGQGKVSVDREVPRLRHAAVPVIGVPGYPLAAAVIFELFGVPVLAALHGRPLPGLGGPQLAVLDCGWTSAPDVEEWIPVTLTPGSPPATLPGATPCKGRGAGALSKLVCADAWRHPIGQGQIHRGDLIEVFPIASALDPRYPDRRITPMSGVALESSITQSTVTADDTGA
jgi:molybdopterin biosynthesis enzyme